MTTYAAFAAAVAALELASCKRQDNYLILGAHTADCPYSFVRLPGGGRNFDTLTTCEGSGNRREIELVVLISPINQNNPEPNFDATVVMMDEIEAAIVANKPMLITDWTISAGSETIGDTPFWAVVASIEGIE